MFPATVSPPTFAQPAITGPNAGSLRGFQLEIVDGEAIATSAGPRTPVPLGPPWDGEIGLLLAPGEDVCTPWVRIEAEFGVELMFVTVGAGAATVDVQYEVHPESGAWRSVARLPDYEVGGRHRMSVSLEHLDRRQVRLRVRNCEGLRAAHIVLALLRVCNKAHAGRLNALSGYSSRLRSEVAHFANVYNHRMYRPNDVQAGRGIVQTANGPVPTDESRRMQDIEERAWQRLRHLAPRPGEPSFDYALRGLELLLPMEPPQFNRRMHEKSSEKPLRILSILSGAARVEEQLLEHCSGPVEITLLDVSAELIQHAADRLSKDRPQRKVQCLVGDINAGLPGDGEYDLIVCVSALHHVAELETVLSQINARLADDGEFWSIGEQIGRNGNRLWPEALAPANRAFAALPSRLRRNAHTGRIDQEISDRDCSINCFEGVRSEELEPLLEAYLVPRHVYKRNAFLWRVTDLTYADNYQLDRAEDMLSLRSLIVAEVAHWSSGGRSTELHGMYGKKTVRQPSDAVAPR